MQCTSCKAELPPGTGVCPICGTPVPNAEEPTSGPYHTEQAPYAEQVSYIDKPEVNPQPPTQTSYPSPSSIQTHKADASEVTPQSPAQNNQPGYADAGPPSSAPRQSPFPGIQPGYPPMGQSYPQQPGYPIQQPGYPGQPFPQQPGYPPNPGYYQGAGQPFPQQPGYPPNPGYYQGMGQPSYPPGSPQAAMFSPPAQRQSHLARNIVIAIFAVLILGLLLGVGGLLLLQRQASTTIPRSTAAANAPITTTDPEALYTQIMSRQPTVNDSLNSQGQTNWQSLNQSGQESCTFNGGALHAKGPQGAFVGCLDTSDTYNNFAIQVQMTIIQGDVAGLTFRADPVGGKLYAFAISPQSGYLLLTDQNGSTTSAKLLTAGNSQAIHTGYNQQNQITIIARNSNIYLYINKQYLTTVNDTTSSAGMVGGIAITKTSPADVAFSNLKIWKL